MPKQIEFDHHITGEKRVFSLKLLGRHLTRTQAFSITRAFATMLTVELFKTDGSFSHFRT